MAETSSILLNAGDRERLTALVADRNRLHKHVQRARIILCSDERLPVLEVARRVGVSRPAVWRWQQRFAEEGVQGLLRDKTRPPGKPPVPPETVAQVLAITCSEPPGEVTHWTGRAVAERVGLALRTIQRISLGGLCRPSSGIGTPSGSASGGSVGRGCSTPCSRRSPRRAPPPTSCRCSTRPRPVRLCRLPAQKAAERPSSWPLARRLLDQDPPQDRLRRPADRLRPDPRAGERQPALLDPARPRA